MQRSTMIPQTFLSPYFYLDPKNFPAVVRASCYRLPPTHGGQLYYSDPFTAAGNRVPQEDHSVIPQRSRSAPCEPAQSPQQWPVALAWATAAVCLTFLGAETVHGAVAGVPESQLGAGLFQQPVHGHQVSRRNVQLPALGTGGQTRSGQVIESADGMCSAQPKAQVRSGQVRS